MSETPTPYDLTQDALIGPMRDILLTAAEPPSGPEFSYPVVDQAVSSSMWSWITRGQANGVLDAGGGPYQLKNFNNSANTATLTVSTTTGTANALVNGFFHQLSQDMPISLPMPSSGTVTYHVCITFDPRDEGAQGGPVRVQTYPGEPPTTFGRHHVVLHKVTRRSNELLTDADARAVRPRSAGLVLVHSPSELPDARSQLWGTLAITYNTGDFWMSRYDDSNPTPRWENLTSPTPTTVAPHPWNRVHAGGADVLNGARVGNRVRLAGKVERTSGAAYTPRADGWPVCTLPASLRPLRWGRYPVAASVDGSGRPITAIVDIHTGGVVTAYISGAASYLTLDGIEFRGA